MKKQNKADNWYKIHKDIRNILILGFISNLSVTFFSEYNTICFISTILSGILIIIWDVWKYENNDENSNIC